MSAFGATLRRELLLGVRTPAEIINPLFFFVVVVSLFPLALSPAPDTLRLIAPGVVWVAALLAVMLSLDSLFRRDEECGALEQLLVAPGELYLPVLARLLAHWLLTGLPLVLVAPLLGYMMQLPVTVLDTLWQSLLLGTPALTVIGAIGAALTVSVRRGGILLALLVLPLYVPVLVFGAGCVGRALEGMATGSVLAILAAMTMLAISLGPFAVALGLRISSGD
ncbi:Heme exporter protein B [Isoalcanivorax pacificus W11-5]|uniref:Heme exporter protein B n=1 Tax=Isoalcanivorax pacificus W11-5 TaxID=391936 RepID=A0A0B4XI06_9GAMM|nr:heme exporter protein CcmB [Isoalcanivorax pacificus]AJD47799.1 Heme exporter protein B [Isoalcanivorax pacificus W11-5]